jgi:hypothetical protein
MIRLFIKECLLFGSDEAVNQYLGLSAWVSVAMLMYALIKLILLLVEKFYL